MGYLMWVWGMMGKESVDAELIGETVIRNGQSLCELAV